MWNLVSHNSTNSAQKEGSAELAVGSADMGWEDLSGESGKPPEG